MSAKHLQHSKTTIGRKLWYFSALAVRSMEPICFGDSAHVGDANTHIDAPQENGHTIISDAQQGTATARHVRAAKSVRAFQAEYPVAVHAEMTSTFSYGACNVGTFKSTLRDHTNGSVLQDQSTFQGHKPSFPVDVVISNPPSSPDDIVVLREKETPTTLSRPKHIYKNARELAYNEMTPKERKKFYEKVKGSPDREAWRDILAIDEEETNPIIKLIRRIFCKKEDTRPLKRQGRIGKGDISHPLSVSPDLQGKGVERMDEQRAQSQGKALFEAGKQAAMDFLNLRDGATGGTDSLVFLTSKSEIRHLDAQGLTDIVRSVLPMFIVEACSLYGHLQVTHSHSHIQQDQPVWWAVEVSTATVEEAKHQAQRVTKLLSPDHTAAIEEAYFSLLAALPPAQQRSWQDNCKDYVSGIVKTLTSNVTPFSEHGLLYSDKHTEFVRALVIPLWLTETMDGRKFVFEQSEKVATLLKAICHRGDENAASTPANNHTILSDVVKSKSICQDEAEVILKDIDQCLTSLQNQKREYPLDLRSLGIIPKTSANRDDAGQASKWDRRPQSNRPSRQVSQAFANLKDHPPGSNKPSRVLSEPFVLGLSDPAGGVSEC